MSVSTLFLDFSMACRRVLRLAELPLFGPPVAGPPLAGLLFGGLVLAGSASRPAEAQVMQITDGVVEIFDGSRPAPPRASRGATDLGAASTDPIAGAPDWLALSRAAAAANLSPALIAAVAWRESHFRQTAVSPAGAIGEMQLTPQTARGLGVDPRDRAQNLRGGAGYLMAMMRRYDGDLVRALAAYNAGPAAVDRYGGVPPFKETQAYVAAVLERLSQMAEARAPVGSDHEN